MTYRTTVVPARFRCRWNASGSSWTSGNTTTTTTTTRRRPRRRPATGRRGTTWADPAKSSPFWPWYAVDCEGAKTSDGGSSRVTVVTNASASLSLLTRFVFDAENGYICMCMGRFIDRIPRAAGRLSLVPLTSASRTYTGKVTIVRVVTLNR